MTCGLFEPDRVFVMAGYVVHGYSQYNRCTLNNERGRLVEGGVEDGQDQEFVELL
jgi:hypothetical protein